jgi:hypothetical protein
LIADVGFLCKAAAGNSPGQRPIIEHHSFSAFSTSWAHNSVPSIFNYSPQQLISIALGVTVLEGVRDRPKWTQDGDQEFCGISDSADVNSAV